MSDKLPTLRGCGTGAGWKRRIETPQQMFAEFQAYTEWAVDNLNFPLEKTLNNQTGKFQVTKVRESSWSIVSFCHYLGVSQMTWSNWRKDRDDLKEAIAVVEERIRDHRKRGAEAGVFQASVVMWHLERDARIEEKRKAVELAPPSPSEASIDMDMVANMVHPDDPDPLGIEDGVWPRPLFSQAQLDAGIPFFKPNKPD